MTIFKKIVIGISAIVALFLFFWLTVYAATVFNSSQVGTTPSNGYVLQTNGTQSTWVATSTLGFSGGGGSGTVTSVDMTVPTGLAVSGNPITTSGTLAVSLQAGYNIPLTASTTNWNNLDNNVFSVVKVASSTSGSGISISTSTNSFTLNIPTASGSNTGQLSSTDWTTFNNKQPAGSYLTASSTLTAGGVATFSPNITFSTTTDTNLLLSIVCGTATCTYTPAWTGTLAAARLNSNVVQGFTNDTNVTATISAQNATLGWQGVLAVARGGTGTSTAPTTQGQLLMADGTGTKYTPGNLVAGSNITLTTSTPGQITITASGGSGTASGTAGNIQFSNGSGGFNANNLFQWDNTNRFLGVGSTTPTALLSVGTGFRMDTNGNATTTGKLNIKDYNIARHPNSAVDYLDIENQGGANEFTEVRVKAPVAAGLNHEGTLSSVVDCDPSSPGTSEMWLDHTTENYAGAHQFVIGAGNDGNCTPAPIVFRDWANQSGLKDNSNHLIMYPDGTNLFANLATSSHDSNVFLQVATTSAGSILRVDSTPGTAIFSVLGTNRVGINTTSPIATLSVQGTSTSATLPILTVASSSGASYLQVTSGGNVNVATLTASSLVMSDPNGNLQSVMLGTNLSFSGNTLNATGGGSGNSAWTIGNGLIYNATSTDSVLIGTSTPTSAQFYIQGSGTNNLLTIASSTGLNLLTVLANGNVGVATTTPGGKIHIAVNPTATIPTLLLGDRVSNNTFSSGTFIDLNTSATLNGNVGLLNLAGKFKVDGNGVVTAASTYISGNSVLGTAKLYLGGSTGGVNSRVSNSDNGVGAGTLQLGLPGETLQIASNLFGFGSSTPGSQFVVQGSTSKASLAILTVASSSGSSYLTVLANGNVGVGTTTPPATLTVQNSVGSTQDIFFAASSTPTLGLEVLAGGSYLSKAVSSTTISTITYTMDLSQGNVQSFVLATTTTITINNIKAGIRGILNIQQDATGSRTITWPSSFHWPAGSAPTLTTTANKVDVISYECYSSSVCFTNSSLNFAP